MEIAQFKSVEGKLADYFRKFSSIYLYGTDIYAVVCLHFLSRYGLKIKGFIAEDNIGNSLFYGAPVLNVKEILPRLMSNDIVVFSARDHKQKDLHMHLFFNGINVYCALSELFLHFEYQIFMQGVENGDLPLQAYSSKDRRINYFGWWPIHQNSLQLDQWMQRFVEKYFPKENFNFYSVFGKYNFIKKHQVPHKIFYSGECLANLDSGFPAVDREYADHCLDCVDLSLGFERVLNSRYLRFPLWLMYIFPPESDLKTIRKIIERINTIHYQKTKDCAVIASHDAFGTRTMILSAVEKIFNVESAGKWRHNTDELWNTYKNDKSEYLKQFKFNICPENVNVENYCTEKIFESFQADAIPLYCGTNNNPEPDVINRDSVIFFDKNSDFSTQCSLLQELKNNEQAYEEFRHQKKFAPTAADYVYEELYQLYNRMKEIVKSN